MAKTHDERQTEAVDKVRELLQSVAILAVQAQDCIGSDKCVDLLMDIENDVDRAMRLNNRIVLNKVL